MASQKYMIALLVCTACAGGKTVVSGPVDHLDDTGTEAADDDNDGYLGSDDCDDSDASVHPDAEEICDGLDNDCDGLIDEEVAVTLYRDSDGDGFGNAGDPIEACDPFEGYVRDSSDCDDENADIFPGQSEVCDDVDNDCNGEVDDGLSSTWYADTDTDGYGDPDVLEEACAAPSGYVADATDCDDSSADRFPGNPEVCDGLDNDCDGEVDQGVTNTYWADGDGDGYGDVALFIEACVASSGYVENADDCDDSDESIRPDASEICDGLDNNCDGEVDEGVGITFYLDADGDGVGGSGGTTEACELPDGYGVDSSDCDDDSALVFPDNPEVCDGLDNNCDGDVDEGVTTSWYIDVDRDGFGDADVASEACWAPLSYVADATDCDDTAADIFPGATESCDGIDNNCDGSVDEGATTTFYMDADRDGFGDPATMAEGCEPPLGYLEDSSDCDDAEPETYPYAMEWCDGVDNNCDGTIDEDVFTTFWVDGDGDGFGETGRTTEACALPPGYAEYDGDCDDTDPAQYPEATEVCNGEDDSCDGIIDEGVTTTWWIDRDGDGYGSTELSAEECTAPDGYVDNDADCDDEDAAQYPGATEVCNSEDDDCNGTVDDASLECMDPIEITGDQDCYDLAVELGGPSRAVYVEIAVRSGVTLTCDIRGEPAFTTSGLTWGSIVVLDNDGLIHGYGGDGSCNLEGDGEDGGDAIETTVDMTIDNTDGDIFGGGGGGGSGDDPRGGGGGAGGGLGCDGGSDSSGGNGGDGPDRFGRIAGGMASNYDGSAGRGGAMGNPPTSGGGGSGGEAQAGWLDWCCGGQGGAGGGWGGGGGGGSAYGPGDSLSVERNPGYGGDAGYAVRVRSGTVTWEGGYTLGQVKGSVE